MAKLNTAPLNAYIRPKPRAYKNITIAIEVYEIVKDLSEKLNTTISGTVEALADYYEDNNTIK